MWSLWACGSAHGYPAGLGEAVLYIERKEAKPQTDTNESLSMYLLGPAGFAVRRKQKCTPNQRL